MHKIISIVIGLIVVVAVGWVVFSQKQVALAPTETELSVPNAAAPVDTAPVPTEQGGTSVSPKPEPKAAALTLAVVATHANRASCWSVINGTVYDLTSWIPQHPGGESAILKLCGVDGSARFNAQHGGGKKQEAILLGFALGPLAP